MPSLLAVDLGLRTGLALYGDDGRLRWVRSQNFGARNRLKRSIGPFLRGIGDVTMIVLEGGGDLAEVWRREAERLGISSYVISAERWRTDLLYSREQRSGARAKQHAERLAHAIAAWSGVKGLTSLSTDAAEAVLVGLWGVLAVGWLDAVPPAIRR